MIKSLARQAAEFVPPVRRLQEERVRLRAQVKEARAEAAKSQREVARLRRKLALPSPGDPVPSLPPELAALDKLNFGCGYDKRDGYLNVDSDPKCDPDLLLKNNDLSAIPRRHYREVLANDVLEHITHKVSLAVLLEWADFLREDGVIHISTSSILGVADQLRADSAFKHQIGWTWCLFGNQAHAGDFHHVGFTEVTLKVHLLAAGFEVEHLQVDDGWLFRVDCRKSYDWTAVLEATQDADDDNFIRAIHAEALYREPQPETHANLAKALSNGTMTRRDALKFLMSAPERLYVTANRHGF